MRQSSNSRSLTDNTKSYLSKSNIGETLRTEIGPKYLALYTILREKEIKKRHTKSVAEIMVEEKGFCLYNECKGGLPEW
jgi:hypothetical protein